MMCRADTATQQNETYSLCFGTAKLIQVFESTKFIFGKISGLCSAVDLFAPQN